MCDINTRKTQTIPPTLVYEGLYGRRRIDNVHSFPCEIFVEIPFTKDFCLSRGKNKSFKYCNNCKKLAEFAIHLKNLESMSIEQLASKIPDQFRRSFKLKLSGKPFRGTFNCLCLNCHEREEVLIMITDPFPLRR